LMGIGSRMEYVCSAAFFSKKFTAASALLNCLVINAHQLLHNAYPGPGPWSYLVTEASVLLGYDCPCVQTFSVLPAARWESVHSLVWRVHQGWHGLWPC
jgi:hypothetical protein